MNQIEVLTPENSFYRLARFHRFLNAPFRAER
jgi:hypothetical protein